MTGLPRRPFTPEPPPPDGLHTIRQEAARRRKVRAIRLSAGGAATAAAAAAVVFAVTGAGAGADVLKPLPPAGEPTSGPVPTATSSPPALAPPIRSAPSDSRAVSGAQPMVTATSQPDDGSGSVTSARPAAEPRSQDAATRTSRSDAPRMTRYPSSYTSRAGARVCGGGSSSDDTGFHNGVGWCPSVSAVRVSGGIRLTFQICRDATAGGRLTFASSREVDLVLRRAGQVVWSWAKVASSHPDSHVLTTPANGCWNWTLVWPGTTTAGKSAPRGTYSLTGASTAQEVSPDKAKTSFTY